MRVNPASGALRTGEAFSVRVEASDDSGLVELRAASAGAAVVPLRVTAGEPVSINGLVASGAGPGEVVRIFANAIDNSGLRSGEVSFEIPVTDATPPALAIVSPAADGAFAPGGSFTVELSVSDNFGASEISVDVNGVFTDSRAVPIVPSPGEATVPVEFSVPADLPADGAGFTITARAADEAGNLSAPITRNLRIPDLIPPAVNFRSPRPGQTGIAPINFDDFEGRARLPSDSRRRSTRPHLSPVA